MSSKREIGLYYSLAAGSAFSAKTLKDTMLAALEYGKVARKGRSDLSEIKESAIIVLSPEVGFRAGEKDKKDVINQAIADVEKSAQVRSSSTAEVCSVRPTLALMKSCTVYDQYQTVEQAYADFYAQTNYAQLQQYEEISFRKEIGEVAGGAVGTFLMASATIAFMIAGAHSTYQYYRDQLKYLTRLSLSTNSGLTEKN